MKLDGRVALPLFRCGSRSIRSSLSDPGFFARISAGRLSGAEAVGRGGGPERPPIFPPGPGRARSLRRHIRVSPRLSPEAASRLGGRMARLYLGLAPSRRKILLGNLSAAFPELPSREIAALARASVEKLRRGVPRVSRLAALLARRRSRTASRHGEPSTWRPRARGKGVFLLSAHFGSWELGAVRAGMLGEPIASVVRPLDNPSLEEELAWRRTRFGNRLIRKRTRRGRFCGRCACEARSRS